MNASDTVLTSFAPIFYNEKRRFATETFWSLPAAVMNASSFLYSLFAVPLRAVSVGPQADARKPLRGLAHEGADFFQAGFLRGFDDDLIVDMVGDPVIPQPRHDGVEYVKMSEEEFESEKIHTAYCTLVNCVVL